MTNMRGGVALITGGFSGIGRAAALAFAKTGATVIATGRREAENAVCPAIIQIDGGLTVP